jgi:hypothetical protein
MVFRPPKKEHGDMRFVKYKSVLLVTTKEKQPGDMTIARKPAMP